MTDEVTPQTQPSAPKKEEKPGEKKPAPNGGQGGGRNPRRNMSRSGSAGGGGNNTGPQRPTSGASNRRNPSNPPANDSGAESKKSSNDNGGGRKPDQQRNRPQGQGNGNARGGNNRKGSQGGGRHNNRESVSRQNSGKQTSPAAAAAPASEGGSDALSSLQRVIADLKTASPSVQSANMSNPLGGSAPVPIPTSQSASNLPANAPVFQPGAAAFPGLAGNEPPRHRKAASLGTGSVPNNFNSYSPNLGSMMEDVVEEGPGGASFEEGEIQENPAPAVGGHQQRRSLSQSFTAPRFAALAQQDQGEGVGPTGRPQLAPNFMFGARRRPSIATPVGPPINEDDVGFQFPQQQQNFNIETPVEQNSHRRTESSGEISGIMAEQVS